MNKKIFSSLLIIFLAIVGLTDAGYMTVQLYRGVIPPCIPGFQCAKVLTSPYANIGSVPLSVIGSFFYTAVLVFASAVYLELPLPKFLAWWRRKGATTLDLLQLLTTGGLLFSIYLVIVMGVIIRGWCTFCLISALSSFFLFIVTGWHARQVHQGNSYFLKGIWFGVMGWLYKTIAKPIFFMLDPETVHNFTVLCGALIGSTGFGRSVLSALFQFSTPKNRKQLAGIVFPNPIGLSAGFDYNGDLTNTLGPVGFGWHTIGTVTFEAYEGNPKPRLTRFPLSKSILVNKGLKNIGSQRIIAKLAGKKFAIPTGFSIASTNKAFASDKDQIMDIAKCFAAFERAPLNHQYYELNISCPNTHGGEPFTTAKRLETLLRVLDSIVHKPLFVKLPIDLPDQAFMSLLAVCNSHQIAGLIIGNLSKDKTNPDVVASEQKIWHHMPGNLSGKPTFKRSTRLVAMASKQYGDRFVIVGTGGIFSPQDAQTKFDAGADLVQLITGMIFTGPQLIGHSNRYLAALKPQ